MSNPALHNPSYRYALDMGVDVRVCLPHIPSGFRTTQRLTSIQALANELPLASIAGLELNMATRAIAGLAFRVQRGESQLSLLTKCPKPGVAEVARAVQSDMCPCVDGLWIEFDALGVSDWSPPRVFLDLTDEMDATNAIRTLVTPLDHPLSAAVVSGLDDCLVRLGSGWRLFQLGWQVDVDRASRMCVRPASWEVLRSGLTGFMPGSVATKALDWCERLRGCVDTIELALDILDGDIVPRVGLEWQFSGVRVPVPSERWNFLAQMLEVPGGMSTQQWERVKLWFGREVDDLGLPLGASVIQRGISHFKTVVSEECVHTKVYIGWHREFRQAPLPFTTQRDWWPRKSTPTPLAPTALATHTLTPRRAQYVVTRALLYLARQRDVAGWWLEFPLASGVSDEWVTAYVAHCLSGLFSSPVACEMMQAAWGVLADRRRLQPGWGFNGLLPADADTTAWVVRVAAQLGVQASLRLHDAIDFLLEHCGPLGATTYADTKAVARHMGWPEDSDYGAWTKEHVDVTANVAVALSHLGVEHQLPSALCTHQQPDGSWTGFWWRSDAFTTWLVLEALRGCQDEQVLTSISQAIRWSWEQLCNPLSVFETTCHLAIQLESSREKRAKIEPHLAALLRQIIDSQQEDGSWAGGATLLVPFPALAAPAPVSWGQDGDVGSETTDSGVFTTATVLKFIGRIISEYTTQ